MRTTVAIEDDVLQAARSLAQLEQRTLGQVISDLLRRALRPVEPRVSVQGLPVFEVSPAAPVLTAEMVRQALDD